MANDRDDTSRNANEPNISDPDMSVSSLTAEQLFESGWVHYSKKEFYRAEADFRKSLEITPGNADAMYALGMTVSASGRYEDAVAIFEKAIELLQQVKEEDWVRANMLTRLARGHINRIKTGDWHLEK
jgi:tetratricopeptide (TPR) repeat protein